MSLLRLIDSVPTWGILILTILIAFAFFEVGFRFGLFRGKRSSDEKNAPLGTMMGATLGLLAFILAFSFSLAANRFLERRELVLEDANAIETCYRRAGYLQEPNRTEIKRLLREYVSVRIPSTDPNELKQLLVKSEEIQEKLWSQAIIVAENSPQSVMAGLFISSLNQVLDIHTNRIMVGIRNRVPDIIWISLYAVTVLSMCAMGYYCGLSGQRSFLINLVMLLAFSGVIFLIADLDSPRSCIIKVSQQPMKDLQLKMKNSIGVQR